MERIDSGAEQPDTSLPTRPLKVEYKQVNDPKSGKMQVPCSLLFFVHLVWMFAAVLFNSTNLKNILKLNQSMLFHNMFKHSIIENCSIVIEAKQFLELLKVYCTLVDNKNNIVLLLHTLNLLLCKELSHLTYIHTSSLLVSMRSSASWH